MSAVPVENSKISTGFRGTCYYSTAG